VNGNHLATHRPDTGRFRLTDAVHPAPGTPLPREGYRLSKFRDPRTRARLPMLSASVSAERLFDVFLALLEPLGENVHVVLESSHDANADRHDDLRRSDIDLPVLMSHFCDHEELLFRDGCLGVAVLSAEMPIEVQFDEHKLLYVYSPDLRPFRKILRDHGVRRRETLRLLTEAEHVHVSDEKFADEFRQLCMRLGVGDFDSVLSDDESWQ